jgi:protein SDA1
MIQAHVRRKMSKEERLGMVQAGREDRGKYLAATAVGKKKVRLMLLHLCFC